MKKYKHALFLNPYTEAQANGTMKLFPPTGLEYVATSAKPFVEKLTLLDLRMEEELSNTDNLMNFIRLSGVDIICVCVGWDRQYEEICKLLNLMPEGIPLVVGGYKATEKVEELFAICPRVSIVVRGEGEESIKEIMQDRPLNSILGISFRQSNSFVHNSNRPLIDVNKIPVPDRSLRRKDYYLNLNGINVAGITFDSVLTARGCPFNCKFCTFSLNPLGQKRAYSARSVESVIEEIASLKAKVIIFSDDNLFVDPKRIERICDLIIERKFKKRFIAQARIEIAKSPTLLAKMVKAGFKTLLIGIESPHDRILAQLDKGFTQAKIREAFKVLMKYPIFYSGYFIYGNIGETKEEMLYIPKFAKELGVDVIACNKLRIEKFSPLREVAENTPGYHITDRGELYSDAFSHADLKKIGRTIKFSFYTPGRFVKILWKNIFITRFFTFREFVSFIFLAPRLLASTIAREIHRGRLKDSLKRTFIQNKA